MGSSTSPHPSFETYISAKTFDRLWLHSSLSFPLWGRPVIPARPVHYVATTSVSPPTSSRHDVRHFDAVVSLTLARRAISRFERLGVLASSLNTRSRALRAGTFLVPG